MKKIGFLLDIWQHFGKEKGYGMSVVGKMTRFFSTFQIFAWDINDYDGGFCDNSNISQEKEDPSMGPEEVKIYFKKNSFHLM